MIGINSGTKNRWALNNSVKNQAYGYVKHILAKPRRAEFEWFFKKRGRNYYVAEGPEGAMAGFAILGPNRPSGTTRLYLIGTRPGGGIGGALMQQIEENARQRGVRKIRVMDPVTRAVPFYRHLGYRRGRKIKSSSTMTKRLNKQKSPSRPSPARPSASPRSSARQSARRQTPRR